MIKNIKILVLVMIAVLCLPAYARRKKNYTSPKQMLVHTKLIKQAHKEKKAQRKLEKQRKKEEKKAAIAQIKAAKKQKAKEKKRAARQAKEEKKYKKKPIEKKEVPEELVSLKPEAFQTLPSPISKAVLTDKQITEKSHSSTHPITTDYQNDEKILKKILPDQKTETNSSQIDDTQEESNEEATIYLNFENTELSNFINFIADLHDLNIVTDKDVKGSKISLNIRQPLTKIGAYNAFLTILEMAGFSIVQSGDIYKIIPQKNKLTQPFPAYINVSLDQLPDNDSTICFVTFLQNIEVKEVEKMISDMLPNPSKVIKQDNINGLIITGKSNDIKSAMKIVQELDQSGLQESVVVIRLNNANATDVKKLFESLMEKPQNHPLARLLGKQEETSTSYFAPTTKIIAEERTNSLILLGNMQSIEKIENFVKEQIDTVLKNLESPLHIYELQYAQAQQIAQILQDVTSPEGLKTEAGQQASKHGGVRGGVKYFRNMTCKADTQGNRLIISCADKQDWKLLKKTIDDLDKPNPQVALETLIVAVDSKNNKFIGTQLRGKKRNTLGNLAVQTANITNPIFNTTGENKPISLLGNLLGALVSQVGSTVLTFGKTTGSGIWGIFQMIEQISNASVLSQPFVTVANKAKGVISVGETQRVPKDRAVSDTGTVGENSATGFIELATKTEIGITPQINMDGIIKFEIDVEISNFTSDAGDRTIRTLNTNATVADGQVLVLGGFVRTILIESVNKTPILHAIPLIGWLFKRKQREIRKDYIFIFMCPTIIKPRTTAGLNLYTKMKLHKATFELNDSIQTKQIMDPIHNWFFNSKEENYTHKIVDFASARYQPTTVDIANDPFYRTKTNRTQHEENRQIESSVFQHTTPCQRLLHSQPDSVTDKQVNRNISTALKKGRNKLKEMLGQKPLVSKQPWQDSKRQQLKRFLTNNPADNKGGAPS